MHSSTIHSALVLRAAQAAVAQRLDDLESFDEVAQLLLRRLALGHFGVEQSARSSIDSSTKLSASSSFLTASAPISAWKVSPSCSRALR